MSPKDSAPARTRLFVAKDEHKFSCAHMTIFADGSKERLHGHNYHVACAIELDASRPGELLDFALVKRVLSDLCAELREHLLVPRLHPNVEVVGQVADGEIDLRVCGRRYVLPSDEVLLLPVGNLVVEALAAYLWARAVDQLLPALRDAGVLWLEVTVTESPGQGASYRAAVPPAGESS